MSAVEQQPRHTSSESQRARGSHRRGRGRGNTRQNQASTRPIDSQNQRDQPEQPSTVPRSARARNFGAQLSSSTQPQPPNASVQSTDDKQVSKRHVKAHEHARSHTVAPSSTRLDSNISIPDLTARLMETLKTPPYADCVICWSAIHPTQPTWSCTVSEESNRCCWGVFHNKCIVAWSKKSIEESRATYRARNEDREGEWRCPGCQTQRTNAPGQYRCFCGAVVDPKPGRLAMPHSCGMSCQRSRASCDHPCPLECHPGPCPPCATLTVTPCHCNKTTLSLRCNRMTAVGDAPLSCGAICNKPLQCGTHKCQQICHPGECQPCGEVSRYQCYCGRNSRVLACGEGKLQHCADGRNEWDGRFACDEICNRDFDCGKHACKEACHPHSFSDSECPRSPNKVRTCCCGKKTLEDLDIIRSSCTDPLPCCESRCEKPLKECDHPCAALCHLGACPPCQVEISRPCRCGETIQRIPCWKQGTSTEFICNKVCRALRNCGKHVCNRACCPLAHIVKVTKNKGRQSRTDVPTEGLSLHECDLTCSKLLNCGLHRCERKDHKGICPPCLQSSFDEMSCICGRTTLIPPIPCGTQVICNYPCNRPPPSCGHPKTSHTCHQEGSCPPCPFLTARICACGKMTLPNVRCSQPKVSCGTPCGKLLPCGFHACQRLCHSDDCGPCESVCGKDRKLCLPDHHPCTRPCHAPSACPEIDACQGILTLECPCGRIKRQVPCGRSDATPAGRSALMQPKCTSECQIAQRNARLAEALGIEQGSSTRSALTKATYAPELVSFAKANHQFVRMVEGALAEFVGSERATHALPHMPEGKRSFVYGLAKVYRIDTRMVDVEPQRSVELIRRIDTRIPVPLLSAVAQQAMTTPASLGKLQTKTSTSATTSPARSTPLSLPSSGSTGRAWAAVASSSRTSPAQPPSVPLPVQNSSKSTPTQPSAVLPRLIENDARVPVDWEADD